MEVKQVCDRESRQAIIDKPFTQFPKSENQSVNCGPLVAHIVLHKNQKATAGELRNYRKDRLPDYMVASRFVFLNALPVTLNGKLDRKALPEPDYAISELEENFVAPKTPSETMLAGIWKKILKIKRVGVYDNFFELGGHSLLVAALAAEIKKKTGKTLPVSAILQSPTISQMVKVLWSDESLSRVTSIMANAEGKQAPFFWVSLNKNRPPYLGPDRPVHSIILQGDYGKPMVYKTIEELAAHHLEEVKSVQPKGPYLIGGYCFSAVVASEMAHQLMRQGEKVSLLCLIEPLPFCQPRPEGILLPKAPLKSKAKYVRRKLHLLLNLRKILYVSDVIAKGISAKANYLICRTLVALGRSVPRRYRDDYREYTVNRYVAGPYPGKAVVFLKENRRDDDWSAFGSKGTFVSEVSGTLHHTIMDGPYAGHG